MAQEHRMELDAEIHELVPHPGGAAIVQTRRHSEK